MISISFFSNIFSFRVIWLCLRCFKHIGGRHFCWLRANAVAPINFLTSLSDRKKSSTTTYRWIRLKNEAILLGRFWAIWHQWKLIINKPWKWMPYAERQLVCLYLFQAFMRLIPQRMTCLHSAVSRLAKFYELYTDFLLANKWVIFSCPAWILANEVWHHITAFFRNSM